MDTLMEKMEKKVTESKKDIFIFIFDHKIDYLEDTYSLKQKRVNDLTPKQQLKHYNLVKLRANESLPGWGKGAQKLIHRYRLWMVNEKAM